VKGAVDQLRRPEQRACLVTTMAVSALCGIRGMRLLPAVILALLAGEAAKRAAVAAGHLRVIAEAVDDGGPGAIPPA
jgi:hypothetical protein